MFCIHIDVKTCLEKNDNISKTVKSKKDMDFVKSLCFIEILGNITCQITHFCNQPEDIFQ